MPKKELKFEKITDKEKEILLDALGYGVDEDGIIIDKSRNEPYIIPDTGNGVFFENASVLPGSTIIIDTNDVSLAEYITKYIEKKAIPQ